MGGGRGRPDRARLERRQEVVGLAPREVDQVGLADRLGVRRVEGVGPLPDERPARPPPRGARSARSPWPPSAGTRPPRRATRRSAGSRPGAAADRSRRAARHRSRPSPEGTHRRRPAPRDQAPAESSAASAEAAGSGCLAAAGERCRHTARDEPAPALDDGRGRARLVDRLPRRNDRQRGPAGDRREPAPLDVQRARGPDLRHERLPGDARRAAHPGRRPGRLLRPAAGLPDRPDRVRAHLRPVRAVAEPRAAGRLPDPPGRGRRAARALLAVDHHGRRSTGPPAAGRSGSGRRPPRPRRSSGRPWAGCWSRRSAGGSPS